MISLISDTSSEISTKDENNKSEIKKKHSHIVKEQQGKYDCIYSVDDDGKKTLIEKIPVLRTNKIKDKNDEFNNLFNFDNPKFVSEAVINNTRASLNFRQQMYHHDDDLKEIIDFLKSKPL